MAFWDRLLNRKNKNKDISEYLEEKESIEAIQNREMMENEQNLSLLSEETTITNNDEQKLFIPSVEIEYYTSEQIAYMKKLVQDLPPLEKNNVNFRKWNLSKYEEGWMLQLLFRNGSFDEVLSFDHLPITVMDQNEEVICQQEFDFTNEEPIPPRSVRFCTFIFEGEQVLKKDTDISNWSIKLG